MIMNEKDSRNLSQVVMEEMDIRSRRCQKFVRTLLLSEKFEYEKLREALKHYFTYWNDPSHPGLFSVACEAVGCDPTNQIEPEAALSMLAAAFDLHDDIIDGSKSKNGVPTVLGKYGPEITLLLGNAFMTYGFTLMGKAADKLPRERSDKVFSVLKTLFFEVGNAHASELSMKHKFGVSPRQYMRIIEKKAASTEADMRIGALFGGGNAEEIDAMARCGRILGTLAMLREEFIDVFDKEELNHRIQSETLPVPILYSLQVKELKKEIEEILDKKRLGAQDIHRLLDIVMNSSPVEALRKHMKGLVIIVNDLSRKIPNVETRKLLNNMVTCTLEDL